MAYIIHNGENYLKQTNGSFSIVNNINEATKWDKISKANNLCDHMSRNRHFKDYHLKVKYVVQENKKINAPAKPIELDYDILDKIKEIAAFSKQLEERRLYLIEQIHESDLNIVDIEHAAEFYTLNASQGYKLYKLLHDERNKRRRFKDELEKIELSLGSSIKSISMENLERSIVGLDNRKYIPRVNKELFGM